MDVVPVFAVVAVIIGLGFFAEIIFQRTNVPDVLILILTGILLRTLGWVHPSDLQGTALFTTFALVFILFQGALNLRFSSLLDSLSGALALSTLSFLITALAVMIVAVLFRIPLLTSLFLGLVLGGTSSAVVVPIVNNLKQIGKHGTALLLESAITDVLCIVGAITVLGIIETGTADASGVFRSILASFALAIVVGSAAGVAWIFLLHKYLRLTNAYMLTVAVVIGLFALVESPLVAASGAIAALAFGLILGNADLLFKLVHLRKEPEKKIEELPVVETLSTGAKSFYAEIAFFVKVFFFVYLGILFDFSDPWVFVYGAILTLVIYAVRPFAVRFVFKDADDRARTIMEVLVPKGLAAAVLAQLAVQHAIPGAAQVANIVLAVVLLSILATSALVFVTEKGWYRGVRRATTLK